MTVLTSRWGKTSKKHAWGGNVVTRGEVEAAGEPQTTPRQATDPPYAFGSRIFLRESMLFTAFCVLLALYRDAAEVR